MVSKVYSISKELGDKAAAHLAGSAITKKKSRNIVPTLSGIDKGLYIPVFRDSPNS